MRYHQSTGLLKEIIIWLSIKNWIYRETHLVSCPTSSPSNCCMTIEEAKTGPMKMIRSCPLEY
jgi:hypothetical protein